MKKEYFVLVVFCLGLFLSLIDKVDVTYVGPDFLDGVLKRASSEGLDLSVEVIDRTVVSEPPPPPPPPDSSSGGGCTVNTDRTGWSCPEWDTIECSDGRKVRMCRTNCGTFSREEQACEPICVSNVQCDEEWIGDCDGEPTPEINSGGLILSGRFLAGEQRTCRDLNHCVDDSVETRTCGDFCRIRLDEEEICGERYLSAYCVEGGERLFYISINAWHETPPRLVLVFPSGEPVCRCSVPLTRGWNHVSPGCVEDVSDNDFFGDINGQYNVVLVWDAGRGEYTGWNVLSGRALPEIDYDTKSFFVHYQGSDHEVELEGPGRGDFDLELVRRGWDSPVWPYIRSENIGGGNFYGAPFDVGLKWNTREQLFDGWNVRSGQVSELQTETGLGYFIGKDRGGGERRSLAYRGRNR